MINILKRLKYINMELTYNINQGDNFRMYYWIIKNILGLKGIEPLSCHYEWQALTVKL